MRRLITLGLILGLGLAGCTQQPPKAEQGVSIKETIPAEQMNPAPAPEPAPVVSHAPPGEEDVPTDATATPAPVVEEPATPIEIVEYPGTIYGSEIHGPAMTVPDFLEQAASLEGKVVTLEGTLGQVCQDMGCWFFLHPDGATKDNKMKVYVDLQMGAIFTIPEDTEGKHAVVTGKVSKNANGYKLVGKGAVLS